MERNYPFEKLLAEQIIRDLFEGGAGSGHWGHRGRPGYRGGSLPRGAGDIKSATMEKYVKAKKAGDRWSQEINFQIEKLRALFGGKTKYQYSKALRKTGTSNLSLRSKFPKATVSRGVYPGFKKSKDAVAWMKKQYPHLKIALGRIPPESFNPTLKEFHRLAGEYPNVTGTIKEILVKNIRKGVWADIGRDYFGHGGHRIRLSSNMYNHPETFTKAIEQSEQAGWHPKGCKTIEHVMTHEFGHAVMNVFMSDSTQFLSVARADGVGYRSDTLRKFVDKNWAGKETSMYAAHNIQEGFAEGFASLRYTPRSEQSAYTKKLGTLLDAMKKKAAKGISISDLPIDKRSTAMKEINDFAASVGIV